MPKDDTPPDYTEQFAAVADFFNRSEDRVIAIIAAAYCETWIRVILEARMPGLADVKGRLFSTGRPLGTADARYDLARALNVILPSTYADLKRLATIRNRFAHQIAVDSFDHAQVAQHVDNLETTTAAANPDLEPSQAKGRRGHFIANALALCMKTHNAVHDVRRRAV